ncbi:MAG: cysteine desulfurase [Candidatus Methanomethylicia archaeon]|nr:cysteine desulfurase [Candidatus Methanomethylicia archaeon]MDW7988513.1 cysteine desulfurase [Nitrososphaerota archaeon]
MLNIKEIRRDFPILEREINGRKLIYFDNAATSQKPIQVINKIVEFYTKYYANIHRGIHTLSQEASELYEEARETIAKFINSKPKEIVFVKNTTEAINIVAYTWALRNLNTDDEIIVSLMEHHSNITPWITLSKIKGVKVKFIGLNNDGTLKIEDIPKLITDKTKLISITHVSNVLGTINNVKEIVKIAKEKDIPTLIDGAQSVPHIPVNVKEIDCEFLAFSGHKMLGPSGIGVLYIREEFLKNIEPTISGGGTIKNVDWIEKEGICKITWGEGPEKLEAGTPNIAGAIGLSEAVKYLMRIGIENIFKHEKILTEKTINELKGLEKVKIYGPLDVRNRSGIIAFNIGNLDPHQTALILDQYGIAVRSGMHCAEPLHQIIGARNGSVRASYYLYNTENEIYEMIKVLKYLEEIA